MTAPVLYTDFDAKVCDGLRRLIDRGLLPAGEIRFIRGRVKFGGAKWNAPFPSAIVIFRGTPPTGVR
jgi:hypothetical protein